MNEILELEKYDLHCHLDGSLSASIIRKLAQIIGKDLPDEKQLIKMLQVQPDCRSLKEYLTKFELPLSCLITKESFRMAVEDVLEQGAREHVVYMEIRFAPFLSAHETLSAREIIEGALDGLQQGKEKYGVDGNLILCGMRHMDGETNIRLVELAREYLGLGVCAVDLAGDEASFPVTDHSKMFHMAQKLGIPYTIHVGECGSTQSVWDALELGVSRIGHGIAAAKDTDLMKYCAQKKVCFEMCPTSNLQTKAVYAMTDYPFLTFLEAGIPVTVNTDNRMVSHTTITEELLLLQKHFHITGNDMKQLMNHAREAAFR